MLPSLLLLIAFADDFDRLEGPALSAAAKSAEARSHESLTIAAIGNLPNVLNGTRSALIVVKTDEGNPARLLVSPALRNQPAGKGEPIPILIVERFDTFEAGPATRRIARGRDLILFDGFRLDLDTGQVVPEGQGGDIQFQAGGEGGPRLKAVKPSDLFTFASSPLPHAAPGVKLSPGRSVAAEDFAGTFRLFANGQTSGRLELKVGEGGVVTGRLRSDQTGGSYKVSGQVDGEAANRVRFAVELPRARQEFDGLLFVEGKGAIAGSYSLLNRTFGFFATRDGGSYLPEGEELGGDTSKAERPGRTVVVVTTGAAELDGKTLDDAALATAMKSTAEGNRDAWASLRVAADVPAGRLMKVVEILRNSGVASIRIESPGGP